MEIFQNTIFVVKSLRMKQTSSILLIVLFAISIFYSCDNSSIPSVDKEVDELSEKQVIADRKEVEDSSSEDVFSLPSNPIEFSKMISQSILDKDFESWPEFSNETVFFSPYAFVDTANVKSLNVASLNEHYNSNKKMVWGFEDGTGDTIKLSFKEYVNRYISDFDLTDSSLVEYSEIEKPVTRGNELHNVQEIYPEAVLVEAYKPSDDEMDMNWLSLMFVLKKEDSTFSLIGLVHNEWTI